MRLKDYEGIFFNVVCDGEFETLGKLSNNDYKVKFLVFIEAEQYLNAAMVNPNISCIVCTQEIASSEKLKESNIGIAVSRSPRCSFFRFHKWLSMHESRYENYYGKTYIGEDCIIHPTASIASSGVIISDSVIIEENAVIRQGTSIGRNTRICAGAIIGGENDLCYMEDDGNIYLIPQVGKVEVGNYCEIGYHAVVARGTFPQETTTIGHHTYIDMGTMIAHHSWIGNNVIILAQAQVCGNTVVQDYTRISPQAIISNGLRVGEGAHVSLGSVVVGNVASGKTVSGNFAIDHGKFLKWHRKKMRDKS